MHPVATAVAPLKADAIKRAKQEATKIVDYVAKELAAHDYVFDKAAPYPDAFRMSTRAYHKAKAKRCLFNALAKTTQASYNAPFIAKVDPTKVDKFIEQSCNDAAAQYDVFVVKLTHKIGDVDTATLDGNHVWGYSILTVTKTHTTERWKTQQIVNTSKLGKLFNQWPSRRMK